MAYLLVSLDAAFALVIGKDDECKAPLIFLTFSIAHSNRSEWILLVQRIVSNFDREVVLV